MALEKITSLLERKRKLHRDWLDALSRIESATEPMKSYTIEVVLNSLRKIQKELMEEIVQHTKQSTEEETVSLRYIQTLYEQIEELQKQIDQKHTDLDTPKKKAMPQENLPALQLSIDHSLDLLKHLARSSKKK